MFFLTLYTNIEAGPPPSLLACVVRFRQKPRKDRLTQLRHRVSSSWVSDPVVSLIIFF